TVVQPNKPGSCPYLPRPSSCSSRPRECNIDIDCSGDLKCCDNGCGKICVSTDYTPPPIDFLKDKCPPYSPNRQCPRSVQDECTCDSDCDKDDGYKCCFDGCRRFCRKKAGQICTTKVDIIYLMDSSGSIGAVDFERQKDFVKDLARIFSVGPGASRAAVVTYNDYPTVRSNFGDFDSTDEFAEAVESINQTRGRTRIDRALAKTSEMFESARKNVPKVLIALTDGSQTPDPDAIALDVASQSFRDQNVRVFALGVGHQINVTQLRSMVESNSDVFLVDSFVDLLRKSQTIAEKACSEIVSSCVQGVDVAFLMDSSESITDEDFEREKTAVKEIARRFLRASPDSRAGVIMYSGRPELSIDFKSQTSLDNFQSAVDALTHTRSMTRIDLALRYAAESLFLNPRSSVSSIAVVMTDGLQTPGPSVEPLGQAVLPLRSKGVRVLAVGVGPRVDRNELKDLVTNQDDVFQMSSFQELLDKSNQLLEAVCP
ncbi:collagen alpha-4(VI) chain-like, partial [Oculina patagonica]